VFSVGANRRDVRRLAIKLTLTNTKPLCRFLEPQIACQNLPNHHKPVTLLQAKFDPHRFVPLKGNILALKTGLTF
jgi:hypothetical protein